MEEPKVGGPLTQEEGGVVIVMLFSLVMGVFITIVLVWKLLSLCFAANRVNLLYFAKISKFAKQPKRMSSESAGYDLYSVDDVIIPPSETRLVGTGIRVMPPVGSYTEIKSRSGLAREHSLFAVGGVIDRDYVGEVKVILYNGGKHDYQVKRGERVCQLLLRRQFFTSFRETGDIRMTERGEGGFGSTG